MENKNSDFLFNRNKKRFLMALEATSDGVWDWNILTGQIITSPSYFTMLGYNAADLDTLYPDFVTSYAEFIKMVHAEDRKCVDKYLHEHLSSKDNSCEIELRMKTKSGGWKWILKRGKAIAWDDAGNPVRMIGTHIDINEKKLAKDELKKSQQRAKAQYMGMPLPTYTWQKIGQKVILVNFNTAAYNFTNGKISNYIGKEARVLYKENPEILNNILKTYHQKNNCKFEAFYHMFTTDSMRYVKFTCAYIAPDMVLVHMEDITKQKTFEKKIQQSEKNLRNLTEQLFRAEENMRKYIAQELHDSIGQYLSSVKYIAEKTIDHINTGSIEQGRFSLDALVSITQTTIDEVSRISMGLHPSTLNDLGILATVSWFCREYSHIYPGISLEKEITIEENDVPTVIKTPLFRILQESLNNVARHSKATEVRVELSKTADKIELFITDNGIGFDVQEKVLDSHNLHKGFGLISMWERTKFTGGAFHIDSIKKKGTKIKVAWPCK